MGFREDLPIGEITKASPILSQMIDEPFISAEPVLLFRIPEKAFPGVETCSSNQSLVRWPHVVWDVNGYYWALGVGWAATRKELLRAYLARDGQADAYLTYVLSQLLNIETRRKYDAAPFRSMFYDRYVEEEVKRRAARLAKAQGDVSADEILKSWGFETEDEDSAEVDQELDIPQEDGDDGDRPAPWPYTYFIWNMHLSERLRVTTEHMIRWQETILAECQRRQVSVSFGVGAMGGREADDLFLTSIRVMSVAGATVVFIAVDHLGDIEKLAPLAVNRLIIAQGL